jgi:exopolyphosphatase/guanosine-5'-triphosphate,3'-diphosphate pyrophosphatase
MKNWMKDVCKQFNPEVAIGTGGNINALYKLCGLDNNQEFKYDDLKQISKTLKNYSVKERMEKYELRPDRADVITHASKIYIGAMKSFGITKMIVPKIGVADGIIYQLYKKQVKE